MIMVLDCEHGLPKLQHADANPLVGYVAPTWRQAATAGHVEFGSISAGIGDAINQYYIAVPPELTGDMMAINTAGQALTPPQAARRAIAAKWAGAAEAGGKIFGIPYNASQVLVIDAETGAVRGIPVEAEGHFKWHGGVSVGGKVFGVPDSAGSVLVVDVATETARTLAIPTAVLDHCSPRSGARMWSGAVAVGGKVYGIPCRANAFLCIDVVTEAITAIPVPEAWLGGGENKWSGGAAYNGRIFAMPVAADYLLVLHIASGTFTGAAVPAALAADLRTNRLSNWTGPTTPQQTVRSLVIDPGYDPVARAQALAQVPPVELVTLGGDRYVVAWPDAAALHKPRCIDLAALASAQHPALGAAGSFKLLPSDDVLKRFFSSRTGGRDETGGGGGGGSSSSSSSSSSSGGGGAAARISGDESGGVDGAVAVVEGEGGDSNHSAAALRHAGGAALVNGGFQGDVDDAIEGDDADDALDLDLDLDRLAEEATGADLNLLTAAMEAYLLANQVLFTATVVYN
jgi:uncharacterized membrane protein YgcG